MTRKSRFKKFRNQTTKVIDESYEDDGEWEWLRDEKTLPKKVLRQPPPKNQPGFGSVDAPPPPS